MHNRGFLAIGLVSVSAIMALLWFSQSKSASNVEINANRQTGQLDSSIHPSDEAATQVPNASTEQEWLNQNLPDEKTSQSSVDLDQTDLSSSSFHVTAIDADTWLFAVSKSMKSGGYSHGQSSVCTVKFRAVAWSHSSLTRDYEGPDFRDYDPNANVYQISVSAGRSHAVQCVDRYYQTDHDDSSDTSTLLELTFKSRRGAESALAAIIKHADPDAARAMDSEADWIKSNLHVGTVVRKTIMASEPGDIYFRTIHLERSTSTEIYPILPGEWRVETTTTEHRKQGEVEGIMRTETTCQLWPKGIDWSKARIGEYEDGEDDGDLPVHLLMITAPRNITCDEVWPDAIPPAHTDNSHLMSLLFQTEAQAQMFVKTFSSLSSKRRNQIPG